MKISVIVPVYNGGEDFRQCLKALAESKRPADQVIVVDDGSTDDIARSVSADHNFKYLRLSDGPMGPARARNKGASLTDADILVFIDADVVVHFDTLSGIEHRFTSDQEIDVLFGSYDDSPAFQTTVSKYKNLLHHYVHQHSDEKATTFWAGCGAIRREAFESVDGFDLGYQRPSIEDIELGMRLHESGHLIRLCPEIQVKHLKKWTLSGMIKTDVFCRAIPWTRLLSQHDGLINDLNLRTEHRISAAAAIAFTGSVLLSLLQIPAFLGVALAAAAVFFWLELPLIRFFSSRGGWLFASKAIALHGLYYLYASAAFVFTKMHIMAQDFLPAMLGGSTKGAATANYISPLSKPNLTTRD